MSLEGKRIGFAITGSHCTFAAIIPVIEELVKLGAIVQPVVSPAVQTTDTRFGNSKDWIEKFETITGKKVIDSIVKAEPMGPSIPVDCMVIAPMTGNTMAKLANGITDTAVMMATKATLRNNSPVVLAVSTNDGLGLNGMNLMKLIATKNIYFVPFGQDDPIKKQNSLVADMNLVIPTILKALEGKQIQPVLIERV